MEIETFVDLEKWPVETQTDGQFNEDEELEGFPLDMKKGRLPDLATKVLEHLKNLENSSLDIAIAGGSESEKSMFVRSYFGFGEEEDKHEAPAVEEKTNGPRPYPHPKYPKLTFWVVPSIFSTDLSTAAYHQKVDSSRYDVYIIIKPQAFEEQHSQLVQELQTAGTKVFLVCTIDVDLEEKSLRGTTYDKDSILQESSVSDIEGEGLEKPHVYLLSCSDLGKYDFEILAEDLEVELPTHKRNVFLLSLPNVSVAILEKKRTALRRQIWKFATVSCAVSAIPIPGLSVVCDVAILVRSLEGYCKTFGLDGTSLEQLAAKTRISAVDLRALIKSPLIQELSANLVVKLLANATGGGRMIAESVLRHLPVFGSLAAAAISFGTTYNMLRNNLDEIAEDAHRVLKAALEPR
ncbi:interferon-inducible GTPase 5-like [Lissotriton helveticus]